jgi:hypothetical protein
VGQGHLGKEEPACERRVLTSLDGRRRHYYCRLPHLPGSKNRLLGVSPLLPPTSLFSPFSLPSLFSQFSPFSLPSLPLSPSQPSPLL